MKIIDIDILFEREIRKFLVDNKGKFTEEEWENKIPELYEKFGSNPLKELGGKSPITFYSDCTAKELCELIENHVKEGVSISDFLCEAIIENSDTEDYLYELIVKNSCEETVMYALNLLKDKNSVKNIKSYVDFMVSDKFSYNVKELFTEMLAENADKVKDEILSVYYNVDEEIQINFIEILSYCSKDDKVYKILVDAFNEHEDEIPLYSAYLSRYGDEKAIDVLIKAIEKEDITYQDFQELKFAIEKLGGEYDKTRDFSKDASYKKIKNATISVKKNPIKK